MEWLTSAARTSTDQRTCELDRVTDKKMGEIGALTAETHEKMVKDDH